MSTSSLRRVLAGPARAEAPALVGSGVLSVVRVGLDLARPWPLALAVDHALDERPLPTLLATATPVDVLFAAGLATVALCALSGWLDMAATRAAERAAQRVGSRLRRAVFAHSMGLSLRWHGRVRSDELVSRLTSDVGRLLDALVATAAGLVPDLVAVTAVLVLLLAVDPGLAGLGLLVVPLLALLSARRRRLVRSSQRRARAVAGALTGTATDLVRNVAAVQAFGRSERARADFARQDQALQEAGIHAVDVETGWTPRIDVVLAVGAGLVLVVGGLQVRAGLETTGSLLVVLAYVRELFRPVRGLTRLSAVLARASASADRVADVLDCDERVLEPATPTPVAAPPTTVRFRDVSFGYDPAQPVLAHLDLDVAAGEMVCLVGPSGIGKSTTLQLVLRLYDVDGGAVLLDGVDVRRYRLQDLRDAVAYVPQDPWLLDGTLAQNVAFGHRHGTRAEMLRACREALVDEFVDRLPGRHDAVLGEGGNRLSGGQRRRVALARAAMSPARLLLLDEPTAALDRDAAAAVVAAIRATGRHRTTVVATHDPVLIAAADRTVHLQAGPDGARSTEQTFARGGGDQPEGLPPEHRGAAEQALAQP